MPHPKKGDSWNDHITQALKAKTTNPWNGRPCTYKERIAINAVRCAAGEFTDDIAEIQKATEFIVKKQEGNFAQSVGISGGLDNTLKISVDFS